MVGTTSLVLADDALKSEMGYMKDELKAGKDAMKAHKDAAMANPPASDQGRAWDKFALKD